MSDPGRVPDGQRGAAAAGARFSFRVLALLLPVLILLLLDLGLRVLGRVPPPDPALQHARSYQQAFSPLVDDGRGNLSIPPEWIAKDGFRQRTVEGARRGQFFIYPGFRPLELRRDKTPGALRLVALGESTTFGLHVGAEAAFIARLGEALSRELGGRKVEAINLGCPGWASDRVLNLMPQVLALAPDLIVVYLGHNEMLNPGTALRGAPDRRQRLRARLLGVSTLFGWLDHALRRARDRGEVESWREEAIRSETERRRSQDPLLVLLEQRAQVSEDYRAAAARAYQANLRAMIQSARAARVPLLFVLPIANLQVPPAVVEGEQRPELEALVARAREAFARGSFADATGLLEQAVAVAPDDAMTHFLLGNALLRLQRTDDARRALRRAIDVDVKTNRITSPIEVSLIGVVEEFGIPWVDLRPLFHHDLSQSAVEALFVDHCHPTAPGHQAIADALLPPALELLGGR